MRGQAAIAAAGLLVVVGCSGGERPTLGERAPTPTPAPVTATPEPSSGAFVVGDRRFDLEFRCFDVDGTSVFAVGKGVDDVSGQEVTALVQQFPDIDYLALVFGDVATGVAWEPRVDTPIEIVRAADRLTVADVEFVQYTDGVGEPIGAGSVDVLCTGYETEVPENVFVPPS